MRPLSKRRFLFCFGFFARIEFQSRKHAQVQLRHICHCGGQISIKTTRRVGGKISSSREKTLKISLMSSQSQWSEQELVARKTRTLTRNMFFFEGMYIGQNRHLWCVSFMAVLDIRKFVPKCIISCVMIQQQHRFHKRVLVFVVHVDDSRKIPSVFK